MIRTREWRPSAFIRRVPVLEEESEKRASTEDVASSVLMEVRVLGHC